MGRIAVLEKREQSRRSIQKIRRESTYEIKDYIPAGTFYKMVTTNNGDVYFQIENRRIIVKYDSNEENIQSNVAKSSLFAGQTMVKFLETSPDEIVKNPKDYVVNYAKIKFITNEKGENPQFYRERVQLPDEIEPFKKLIMSTMTSNFRMLKKYYGKLSPEDQKLSKDTQQRLLALDKKFRNEKTGDKDILDIYYLRQFSTKVEKDSDLVRTN